MLAREDLRLGELLWPRRVQNACAVVWGEWELQGVHGFQPPGRLRAGKEFQLLFPTGPGGVQPSCRTGGDQQEVASRREKPCGLGPGFQLELS